MKKIIIANWKMNPISLKEAKKLFSDIKKTASKTSKIQTIICPPFVYLNELNKMYSGHRIAFGAQNVFYEERGAYTGEVSSKMLKDIGAKYVIVGHSERRTLGENNEIVNKKVIAGFKNGLNIILCIGENKRDSQALYLKFLKEELESALFGAQRRNLKNLIVAYEPIWAIGKTAKDAMSPHKAHEMYIFIKKILTEIFDKKTALNVPIIYGGSAETENAREMLSYGEIDGLLVGHASLKAEQFNEILKIANSF